VGIADWLQREGAGIVVPPTVQGLRTGLIRLQSEVRELSVQARLAARSRFDRAASVTAYRQLHSQMLEKHKGPTLRDWENRLETTGKTLVRGRPALAKFYEPRAVAEGYMEERFPSLPWRQFEEQERDAMKHLVVSQFGARTDLTLLDLATGSGRLLCALLPFGATTALEGSEEMLRVAQQANPLGVKFVRGDIFDHPLGEKFHVVTCGRLLRHLEYPDRRLLYRRFQELLREDGIAIVEIPNPGPEYQARDGAGWENSTVYDVFWTLAEFRDELNENGLGLVSAVSVGAHLSLPSEQAKTGEPIEHVVAFEKRGMRRV
jgi:2-polyprenyl-3-methyl-5-hydroxy-6-metoxy-1,4-benzoquinol methylase